MKIKREAPGYYTFKNINGYEGSIDYIEHLKAWVVLVIKHDGDFIQPQFSDGEKTLKEAKKAATMWGGVDCV